jgi:hypothetical protein
LLKDDGIFPLEPPSREKRKNCRYPILISELQIIPSARSDKQKC